MSQYQLFRLLVKRSVHSNKRAHIRCNSPHVKISSQFIVLEEVVWTPSPDTLLKWTTELVSSSTMVCFYLRILPCRNTNLNSVFDGRYGNTPPFRDAWFPVGMMDPASFNQVLSNAAFNIVFLKSLNNPPETVEAMKYHAKALSPVNQRIANAKIAASDGMIGAVIGFACYDVSLNSLFAIENCTNHRTF
jgi:hypothetical protein